MYGFLTYVLVVLKILVRTNCRRRKEQIQEMSGVSFLAHAHTHTHTKQKTYSLNDNEAGNECCKLIIMLILVIIVCGIFH